MQKTTKEVAVTILLFMTIGIAGAVTTVTDSAITIQSTGIVTQTIESDDNYVQLRMRSGGTTTGNTGDHLIEMYLNSTEYWQIMYDMSEDRLEMQNKTGLTHFYLTQVGDLWIRGDVSGESITDRTVGPSGSVKALSELKAIKTTGDCEGNKCEIDKSTLPIEMVKTYIDEDTNVTKKARDLTYTVSWLIKANQELLERVELLEAEVAALK